MLNPKGRICVAQILPLILLLLLCLGIAFYHRFKRNENCILSLNHHIAYIAFTLLLLAVIVPSFFSLSLNPVYQRLANRLAPSFLCALGFFVVLFFLRSTHHTIRIKSFRVVEVSYTLPDQTPSYIKHFFVQNHIRILDHDLQVQSGNKDRLYTNIYSLIIPNDISLSFISDSLSMHPDIKRIHFRNNV